MGPSKSRKWSDYAPRFNLDESYTTKALSFLAGYVYKGKSQDLPVELGVS